MRLLRPDWERFRDTQKAFSGVLAWGNAGFNLAPGGEVHLARGLFVSGDFFRVLGVQPTAGRVFTATDDRPGCGLLPGAVVSHSFWKRELAGDPGVVGRKITINNHSVDVIGVAPKNFTGLEVGKAFDVAVPICSQEVLWSEGNWLNAGTVWWLTAMGRLYPGETLRDSRISLHDTSPALFQATLPPNYPAINVKDYLRFRLTALPAESGVSQLRDRYQDPLALLLATAGLVLLIACANLANLMLARATAREHEFAVRLAIGASRGRVIRQLMAESLLLAGFGGGLGLFVSGMLTQVVVAFIGTQGDPVFLDLEPDVRVFAFAAGIAMLACILSGLSPAWRSTRTDAAEAMKTSSRNMTANRERFGFRRILLVAQVALSLVLLVGALLFATSLRKLMAVDTGFDRNGVLVTWLDFSRLNIATQQRVQFKREVLERIRTLPGVASAGEASIVPLTGNGINNSVWLDAPDSAAKHVSYFNWVSEGYFKASRIPLLAGRDFDAHDTTSAPRVAVVNTAFARELGITSNPIGKRFRREATPSEPETAFEIVGMVGDTKYYGLRDKIRPIAYLATAQDPKPSPFAQMVVRSSGPIGDLTSVLRRSVAEINPSIAIDFRSLEETVQEGLSQDRLVAVLSGFFAGLAALIAAIGVYGVMSYVVATRRTEIGVRMALGAEPRSIVRLIVRDALNVLVVGVTVGIIVAVAGRRAVASMLFGFDAADVRPLVAAAALIAAMALLASYVPARRAGRLDPMSALRNE